MSPLIYFSVGFLILITLHIITLYIVFRKRKNTASGDHIVKEDMKNFGKRVEFSWGYPKDDKNSHNADIVLSLADIIGRGKSAKKVPVKTNIRVKKIKSAISKPATKKPRRIPKKKILTKSEKNARFKSLINTAKKDITADLSEKIKGMGISKRRTDEILEEVESAVDRIMKRTDIEKYIDTTKNKNEQVSDLIRLINPMLTSELKKLRYE